jgi:hypothetical protein
MNTDARLSKLEDAAGPELARQRALRKLAALLEVDVQILEGLTPGVWWGVCCAIGEGNLAEENVSDEEFAAASEWQLERIAAGDRPSEVFGRLP